jgi:hypothetical protein
LIHRGEAPAELSFEPKHLNLEFESLNLEKITPNERFSIIGLEKVTEYPAFLLHPPESWENNEPLVFPGTKSTLESIIDSPLRQRIKDGILEGQSTVWILVEGTDQTANEAISKLLNDTLLEAQKTSRSPKVSFRPIRLEKLARTLISTMSSAHPFHSRSPLKSNGSIAMTPPNKLSSVSLPPTGIPHPKNHLSSRSLVVVARQVHF